MYPVRSLGLRSGAPLAALLVLVMLVFAATATGGLTSETDAVIATGVAAGVDTGAGVLDALLDTVAVALAVIYAIGDIVDGDDAIGDATAAVIPPRNTSNNELPDDGDVDIVGASAFGAAIGTDGCATGTATAEGATGADGGFVVGTATGGRGGNTALVLLNCDDGCDDDSNGDVG